MSDYQDRNDSEGNPPDESSNPRTAPDFPSPRELQEKLSEFMKSHFGDRVSFTTFSPEFEGEQDPLGEAPEERPQEPREFRVDKDKVFTFNYRPKDIKKHLDRFVIRQDEAKKALAIAVCDHYNHVAYMRRLEKNDPDAAKGIEYAKQNVILVGPTGVGKTYLVKHIADLIGVPFVKADATKFSETGYVGGDVEDLIRELVQKADGDTNIAQYGIVYIDEIDKLAGAGNLTGRDVSGRGVQTTLLKLMEETDVPVRNPQDFQAQFQAMMEMQRGGGKPKRETISTKNVLFIVSGAFERIQDIVGRRLRRKSIGFGAAADNEAENNSPEGISELLRSVTTQDFIEFGFEPEFVGRLPVRVICHHLLENDLFRIMKESEGSLLRQYERAFAAYGVNLEILDETLHLIAADAAKEKTGARGLLTVTEGLLREFKFELPDSGVSELRVDKNVYEDPARHLTELLEHVKTHALAIGMAQRVRPWVERMEHEHGLKVHFTDEALEHLGGQIQPGMNVPEYCERVLHNFPYGLKLIASARGLYEFELPQEAVEKPDAWLNKLVTDSLKAA